MREFAETMVRNHSVVNQAALSLLASLDAAPQDDLLSQTLVKGAAETRNELSSLRGKALDCAYATNKLGYHQQVNKTVAENVIPNVTVPELKSLLQDALATFKVHQGHAAHMVMGLKCSQPCPG